MRHNGRISALERVAEAAVAFTKTPPDWNDARTQEAYGHLLATLAELDADER